MRKRVKRLRFYPSEIFNWALRFRVSTSHAELYSVLDFVLLTAQNHQLALTGFSTAKSRETVISSFGANSKGSRLKQKIKKLFQAHPGISNVQSAKRDDMRTVNTRR